MTESLSIQEARAVLIQSFMDTGYTKDKAVIMVADLIGVGRTNE